MIELHTTEEKVGEKLKKSGYTTAPYFDAKMSGKYLLKADALRINKMFKESIKHYLSAMMLERDNLQIYMGLAKSYVHLGNEDKAVETFEKARLIAPDDPKIPYEIGCCFMRMGLPCVAMVNLKEAILMDKDNVEAQLQLGLAHEMTEEYDMALMIYQCIIEKHPSFLKAYQHKAALLIELNRYHEATAIFAELLKINPQYYKALLGIGICFDRLGKKNSAMRYYKKFLKLKPNSKNAPDVLNRLERMQKSRPNPVKKHLRLA